MGRLGRKIVGFFCVGVTYQSVKQMVKSNSLIGSGIYSAIGGIFGTGSYKLLRDDVIAERLEELLSREEPNMQNSIRGLLYEKFPSLEKRTQTKDDSSYSLQELKRQIMKEKGHHYE